MAKNTKSSGSSKPPVKMTAGSGSGLGRLQKGSAYGSKPGKGK